MLRKLRFILFPVLNLTGSVLMAFAGLMIVPLIISLSFRDGADFAFTTGAVTTFLAGLLLFVSTRSYKRELIGRDGFLLATIIWSAVPLFAAIPLYLNLEEISFTLAYFEAMSGTTTTCATVLTGLDNLPASINFWRCFLSWLGGMGILVLAVAILPLLGVGGAQIFKAEASGPMKESRLTPRISDTAKGLWWIYAAFTVACCFSYIATGMSNFDAVIHSFTTVSLGGFSSHDSSFGYWNSGEIESVAIFFMVLCGTSFSLHFLAIRKRSFLPYLKNPEFWGWIASVVAVTGLVCWILLEQKTYTDWTEALRHSAFNVISIISTTGYCDTDYNVWPTAAPMLMMVTACFASCGGSTGGGIKMLRALLIVKEVWREFLLLLHPKAIRPITISEYPVNERVVFQALAYTQLWMIFTVLASLVMMASGLDIVTATSAIVACVTNIGPGLANVGPASTFAGLSAPQLWLCSFCMLLGRLEMMTVFVLFSRSFWRT